MTTTTTEHDPAAFAADMERIGAQFEDHRRALEEMGREIERLKTLYLSGRTAEADAAISETQRWARGQHEPQSQHEPRRWCALCGKEFAPADVTCPCNAGHPAARQAVSHAD